MMPANQARFPDQRLAAALTASGHDLSGEIIKGGDYASVVLDGDQAWVSGQVPRVGSAVRVTGRVGEAVSLEQAREAARICALRALVLLQRSLGSLSRVVRIQRVGVYVQCTADFTQHSEVADAASALLHEVLWQAGVHSRTSIGVYQLPKDASVELELVARVRPSAEQQ